MRLSAIGSLPTFALLGPGFGGGGFTLVTELAARTTQARLFFAAYEDRAARHFDGTTRRVEPTFDVAPVSLEPRLEAVHHADAVDRIREAIAAGDVYQVNHTVRAMLPPVDGAALFATLCRRGLPRFAAWVRLPDGTEFVSASPELFFAIDGRRIRVEPMKGTSTPADADVLATSEKDASELAMITDLLRNDLTAACVPRTVRVVNERRFITLPYAVQAVSDVEGELPTGTTIDEVMAALHPGGSITGAPKKAAMSMIAALERSPRGPYCGALGFVDGDRVTTSLLIRTATRVAGGWEYGVGGGIVWDSDPARELEEIHVKLGALR